MTNEEKSASETMLLEKIKTQVASQLDAFKSAIPTGVKAEEIEALKVAITAATNKEDLEGVKAQLTEIGLKVTGLEEGKNKPTEARSIGQAFSNAYKSMFDSGKIKGLKKGQFETMEVKVAGTMTTGNITPVGTNAIPFTLAEYESGLTRLARRSPFIMQLVNMANTVKGYIQWAEQANADPGAAGTTEEGAAKTQEDWDIVEKSAKVEKITAYTKVSTEMLDDVDFVQSEINNDLVTILQLKADEQILKGDGNSPNLKGILEYAQAFAAGSFANAIEEANNYDVLRIAINQIIVANFMPNYIIMHPSDAAMMDLEKGNDGHYIMPPFTSASGSVIKGLPVVENTGITEGDYLVGDFTKSQVRMRKDASISVGYENDDFTKNLVTILGEMRLVHFVKSNHVNAFVTGDFSTDIAAILLPTT